MRRFSFALMAMAVGLAYAGSANAATVVLTFEGVGDLNEVGNYYNGGGGPNYGVAFQPGALGIVSFQAGGSGNFTSAPMASPVTALFFLDTNAAIMDVAAGFTTGFSFFYALQTGHSGSVTVWDGLNGTGSILASLILPSTPNPYEVWVPVGVGFLGTAKSVSFGGDANFIAFDDVTFGSSTPGTTPTPVPPSAVLMGLGGLGFIGSAWRRRKALAI